MKFREDDELLSMSIIRQETEESELYVFTVTDGGYAKRTAVEEYRVQGRGGLGIKAMRLNDQRGSLVGGIVVVAGDEILAIKQSGQVTRSLVSEVPVKGARHDGRQVCRGGKFGRRRIVDRGEPGSCDGRRG